ncbi:HNH/endonuclease VII fold putative polymorphic toxin [Pseudomonas fildesensis]|uniref:HNH/endonuclease VII fold putative polymorphic toxin n=1 Tax=Pseudomonas fildesensis TaxID=1674920 RepID=UPI0009E4CCD9|nr:HNH/endonuclease VII fold putative polymorphic toxin [Pseudomonas fildesensis]
MIKKYSMQPANPSRRWVYQFTREDGSQVLIQDHSAGHKYGRADGIGDQTTHFNLRPIEQPRNGKVIGTQAHYFFRNKK